MKFTTLSPNEAVINNIAAILPIEMIESIKSEGMTKFDFALFIVRTTVHMGICDLSEAFDAVFGNGMYAQFKNEVYEALTSK